MTNAFFPEPVEIDSYGNGGFRFGEMSHKGSLLILPSGVYGWSVTAFEEVDAAAFKLLFEETSEVSFLLFGTGANQQFPASPLKEAFLTANIGLEVMDTGAAARTFNLLLSEGRAVAAALIAVD